jgi:sterol desaturase/sphingolipid hydroxylase (fatty acid hydroxylase superfamily)
MNIFFIFISILSYDIWFYILHRTFHQKSLYLYHKKHHSKTSPTWKDTFIADKLENAVMGLGSLLPALFFNDFYLEMLISSFFCFIRGILHHDERFIQIVGEHHLIHHKKYNYNYGEKWIDLLMDTSYN